MNQEEIKSGLSKFTKIELIDIFSSLDLNIIDKKEVLITNIVNADPPPIPSEIDDFKELLLLKKVVQKETHIVVHQIKENGNLYKVSDKYLGKNIAYFLKGGQIRKKD